MTFCYHPAKLYRQLQLPGMAGGETGLTFWLLNACLWIFPLVPTLCKQRASRRTIYNKTLYCKSSNIHVHSIKKKKGKECFKRQRGHKNCSLLHALTHGSQNPSLIHFTKPCVGKCCFRRRLTNARLGLSGAFQLQKWLCTLNNNYTASPYT